MNSIQFCLRDDDIKYNTVFPDTEYIYYNIFRETLLRLVLW